jgi:hypothetical protein
MVSSSSSSLMSHSVMHWSICRYTFRQRKSHSGNPTAPNSAILEKKRDLVNGHDNWGTRTIQWQEKGLVIWERGRCGLLFALVRRFPLSR